MKSLGILIILLLTSCSSFNTFHIKAHSYTCKNELGDDWTPIDTREVDLILSDSLVIVKGPSRTQEIPVKSISIYNRKRISYYTEFCKITYYYAATRPYIEIDKIGDGYIGVLTNIEKVNWEGRTTAQAFR
jgi:hypothetical protein